LDRSFDRNLVLKLGISFVKKMDRTLLQKLDITVVLKLDRKLVVTWTQA
jgi:hypothetical protein